MRPEPKPRAARHRLLDEERSGANYKRGLVPLIASEREPDRNAATLEVTIGLEQEAITDVFMIPISSKTRSGTIATARVGRTAESTLINRTDLTVHYSRSHKPREDTCEVQGTKCLDFCRCRVRQVQIRRKFLDLSVL